MATTQWSAGELAQATGLTVRTLHYYDRIGLLVPAERNPAGHRVYRPADLQRLYRIVALRQLGFSLEETSACLDDGSDIRGMIQRQLDRVEERLQDGMDLRDRLSSALKTLAEMTQPTAGLLLDLIERTTMFEQYYTPEQSEQIRRRGEQLGPDAIKAVEQEWPELIARVDAAMTSGVDPSDPDVQAMARRWRELVEMFTGGDPGITAGLGRLWHEQGDTMRAQHGGPSGDAFAYIQRAWDTALPQA